MRADSTHEVEMMDAAEREESEVEWGWRSEGGRWC